jgi:uncharacterized RDD family membrane protein YckC
VRQDDLEIASFIRRVSAAVVDVAGLWVAEVALVAATWSAGLLPITSKQLGEGLSLVMILFFPVFPAWPYFALMEGSRWQATIGKRLMGIVVTDEDGGPIGVWRASVRYVAKVVATLPLGLGLAGALMSERRRGLHDLAAGTLVLRAGRRSMQEAG